MPGLDFRNLPADQTRKISGTLMDQWRIDAEALNKSWFADKGKFDTAVAKLNAKYQQMELKAFTGLQQQMEEQQQVQTLIRNRPQGGYAPERKTQLRMELGTEAESLVFPTEGTGRTPFSPAALKGYRAFMEPFAAAAKEQPGFEWGTPVRLQEDLTRQYVAAREQAGYSDLRFGLTNRRQFDAEWDDLMASERNYKWDPKSLEVKSLRTTGRLQQAATKNVSPLGASVIKKKRFALPTEPMTFGMEAASRIISPGKSKPEIRYAQNPNTGERIKSEDGGRTWQKAQ